MSVWPLIAGLGGAAGGANQAMQFYAGLDQKKQIEQLKESLQQILEEGRNQRHEGDLTAREAALQAKIDAGNKDRALRTQDVVGRLEHLGHQDQLGQDRLNESMDQFWNGTMPLQYSTLDERGREADQSNSTRRYGIDTGAATTRRGQDITASDAELSSETSQRNADLASATSQRNTNTNAQRPRARSNILELLNGQFPVAAPDGSAAGTATVTPAPAEQPYTPPPTVQPPAHVTRTPVPVKPRGAAAAPPPGAAPKLPAGLVPGATVTLKNGTKVSVTKVNPDGSFEYK